MLSHANFNVSLLQVCNCSASAIREPVDRLDADPSKVVLVNSLLDRLHDEVRAPGKALPRADGLLIAETEIVFGDRYSRSGVKVRALFK